MDTRTVRCSSQRDTDAPGSQSNRKDSRSALRSRLKAPDCAVALGTRCTSIEGEQRDPHALDQRFDQEQT